MYESASPKKNRPDDQEVAFARIRADLIGRLDPIETPFGRKPLVCEYPKLVGSAQGYSGTRIGLNTVRRGNDARIGGFSM